ncbi:MAG TPA: hypothetical protein V6C85_24230 [Allocoleopsis sp.]
MAATNSLQFLEFKPTIDRLKLEKFNVPICRLNGDISDVGINLSKRDKIDRYLAQSSHADRRYLVNTTRTRVVEAT